MKSRQSSQLFAIFTILLVAFILTSCATTAKAPKKIKVLILPKFESGEMKGDFPGEAQYYYEAYLQGAEEYEVPHATKGNKLYVKDDIALYCTGEGKLNAALAIYSLFADPRFDFQDALILSTGCAGSSVGFGVMGDVYVISATVDIDLAHKVDTQDLADPSTGITWFHDSSYDAYTSRKLNPTLVNAVFELVKDVKVSTTEKTRNFMAHTFDGAAWAVRDPQVLLGTSLTSDNYWKGQIGHNDAVLAVQTYGCPDPYAATEMEDNAIAFALDRLGKLDHLVILRDSVNTDVFMNGATAESLWDPDFSINAALASENSEESADIFATAMENNFKVGKVIIDAFLAGKLTLK